jgi:murein DD-endopeptidase MepM/ murein hydrolase activator NlpD
LPRRKRFDNKIKNKQWFRDVKRQILTDCMNPIQKITDKLAHTTRKTRIVAAGATFLAVCAFGATAVAPIAPDPADLPVKSISQQLELPNLAEQIAALQNDSQQFIHEEQVRRGDSLGSLLTRLGVDDAQAQNFIRSDKTAKRILSLKTGKRLQAETDENGLLLSLHATVDGKDAPTTVTIKRLGDKFVATEGAPQLERRVEMRSREINSSLYAATDSDVDGTKLPDAIVGQIIEMFSNNIDFRSDLKRGDHFSVVYETFYQDGQLVKTGRVLAGEFVNHGTTYQSVWYEDPVTRQGGYYTLDGKSLKQGFLKSPVAYTRVSSGFSNARLHPVFGVWKKHTGIDLAAPLGTPIRAAGDGTVDFVGVQNGYGNMVVLKHWSSYSTAYGHMSRFASGLHRGEKVHQGDVIGYVGATGWATGPHLHYEFRVAGTAKDPNSMKVMAQAPLSAAEMGRFRMAASDMGHRFSLLAPAGQAMAAR